MQCAATVLRILQWEMVTGEPSARKPACWVRRGADGKGPQGVPRQRPTRQIERQLDALEVPVPISRLIRNCLASPGDGKRSAMKDGRQRLQQVAVLPAHRAQVAVCSAQCARSAGNPFGTSVKHFARHMATIGSETSGSVTMACPGARAVSAGQGDAASPVMTTRKRGWEQEGRGVV